MIIAYLKIALFIVNEKSNQKDEFYEYKVQLIRNKALLYLIRTRYMTIPQKLLHRRHRYLMFPNRANKSK